MDVVKFTQMKDGDAQDYIFLHKHEMEFASHTSQRLLSQIVELDQSLSGYKISRLEHCLQTATRAWFAGADIDWLVAALLHDIGDIYAPYNHDEYAAAILRPFIREQCAWVVQVHADFQLFYYGHYIGADQLKRERHLGHPYFDDCVIFCEKWDQASFDPDYQNLPLEFFAPMVHEVFSRPAYSPDIIRKGERVALINPEIAASRK